MAIPFFPFIKSPQKPCYIIIAPSLADNNIFRSYLFSSLRSVCKNLLLTCDGRYETRLDKPNAINVRGEWNWKKSQNFPSQLDIWRHESDGANKIAIATYLCVIFNLHLIYCERGWDEFITSYPTISTRDCSATSLANWLVIFMMWCDVLMRTCQCQTQHFNSHEWVAMLKNGPCRQWILHRFLPNEILSRRKLLSAKSKTKIGYIDLTIKLNSRWRKIVIKSLSWPGALLNRSPTNVRPTTISLSRFSFLSRFHFPSRKALGLNITQMNVRTKRKIGVDFFWVNSGPFSEIGWSVILTASR